MRWNYKRKDPHAWKKVFLFFPQRIDENMHWLEWVERRWIRTIPAGPADHTYQGTVVYEWRPGV